MSKILIIVVIVVLVGGGVYWWKKDAINKLFGEKNPEGEICIHVITPAKNLTTGECREFPTPCDVPDDWEKVEKCSIIKYYLYKNQTECATVKYACPNDLRPFADSIGCGCGKADISY
ncbi:MAG: hypothetical protein A2174_03195 [Candidatus Portnoybacteria bacterium RBG_13_41_18]|uniref:Uncharacterized protein n=1 Tax=Candidatus Portnoybacteria bacterium RBG_13_41_18 TaxID=1801991 RepID=A0A1G2F5B6_9BACT|nr:MAG: hypothetical protein A2174_03195 [Candidatus Portnoybacteria bacterium RBG_13_41_18]